MGKSENFKRVLKQNKKYMIIITVLWLILTIVLVAPIAYTIGEATTAVGKFNLNVFIEKIVPSIISFDSITKIFDAKYIGIFGSSLLWFTVLFLITSVVGFWKSKSKSEYHDVEHGSSDWSEKGEQYTILSRNKGLILAEENCLPLDKRGNLNTLIVGRIWFW